MTEPTSPALDEAREHADREARNALLDRERHAARDADPPPYQPLIDAAEAVKDEEAKLARRKFVAHVRAAYKRESPPWPISQREWNLLDRHYRLKPVDVQAWADAMHDYAAARHDPPQHTREQLDALLAEKQAAAKAAFEAGEARRHHNRKNPPPDPLDEPRKALREARDRATAWRNAKRVVDEYRKPYDPRRPYARPPKQEYDAAVAFIEEVGRTDLEAEARKAQQAFNEVARSPAAHRHTGDWRYTQVESTQAEKEIMRDAKRFEEAYWRERRKIDILETTGPKIAALMEDADE